MSTFKYDVKLKLHQKLELSVAFIKIQDGNNIANFKLPKDGLTLRSAGIVDGVPELRFDASPKVPTILEEDLATVFRLVSENKRPEFFYTGFSFTHPLCHNSRLFMQYSPSWLRWTAVGELLAEADWSMKCLHIGTRTNKDKSVFTSWSEGSELEGLATRTDFPKDGYGPTIMSCECAKVQKSDNEIAFPEEPKMKITDGCSSLYSKYITQIYQSVAYYDEPKFLKMQELIKLIIAVEWLYKEKGVRVDEQWMMKHTCKQEGLTKSEAQLSKKPPLNMIPQPIVFKRPSNDVTINTRETEMRKCLAKHGVERRYGYYDFFGSEVVMFKADGTPCPSIKCLKFGMDRTLSFGNSDMPVAKSKEWVHIPLPEEEVIKPTGLKDQLLKELSHENEVVVEEDNSNKTGMKLRLTRSLQPLAPFPPFKMTAVMTATVDNYDKLYAGEDPNMPVQPGVPGVCEAIIPDVESWNELFSELTVPVPRIWQMPFTGIGEPTATGGVTTSNFKVEEEPLQRKVIEEIHREGDFQLSAVHCQTTEVATTGNISIEAKPLMTSAVHEEVEQEDDFKIPAPHRLNAVKRNQGSIHLIPNDDSDFNRVSEVFSKRWEEGTLPSIQFIFAINNPKLEKQFADYVKNCQRKKISKYFHGTTLACDITAKQAFCSDGRCGICGISNAGMDLTYIQRQRFGCGFYLAPNSSRSDNYVKSIHAQGCNAMLLCDVCPGKKWHLKKDDTSLTGPPPGYDSVYGEVSNTLKFPEVVVYKPAAVMPRYIIVYKKI